MGGVNWNVFLLSFLLSQHTYYVINGHGLIKNPLWEKHWMKYCCVGVMLKIILSKHEIPVTPTQQKIVLKGNSTNFMFIKVIDS